MRQHRFFSAVVAAAVVGLVLTATGCSRSEPSPTVTSTSGAQATSAADSSVGPASTAPAGRQTPAAPQPPPGAPKIPTVKGFTAQAAPADVAKQLAAAMAKLADVSKPTIAGITEAATKKHFGSMAVVAISADHDQDAETRKAYVSGLAAKAGGRGYRKAGETNNGQPAHYVLGGGACVYVWYAKGTIAMLITTRPLASARAFAKAYIAAA